ncbi:uncharacterized protein LOC109722026 [Ananas comosus]|uniref:Uncharacterized protein LOC109722026 n=1 Tax=Ananas comosus TaxID=4615 RepID=A0A6P5GHG9_ANACO|nr:uncharacterized protein LOC109722026 [Ananas comosus]XP_020105463.1 uncharacterized protein LOC109722026 [Ananas comosus]XP_020105464.1 uncharacterized protein LOC109722026 [Ananas comosus]
MGRAMRWMRRILGGGAKKEATDDDGDQMRVSGREWREKRRWSFVKPRRSSVDEVRRSSASFAAAAAAAASASASAARVTPASSVEIAVANRGNRKARAAIVIQKVFRGYLARKALRALKALVKIQALVRGYLVRKQTTTTLHRLQALVRLQVSVHSHKSRALRADVRRIHPRVSSRKSFLGASHESPTSSWDRSPKIVEVDTCQPLRSRSARMTYTWAVNSPDTPRAVAASSPLLPVKPLSVVTRRGDGGGGYGDRRCLRANRTAQNTPRHVGGTCESTAITPVLLRRYSHWGPGPHPSYMSDTCSSVARSRSAPKQRPDSVHRIPSSGPDPVSDSGSGSSTNRKSCSHGRDGCSSDYKSAEGGSYKLISTELLARDYYLDRMW